MCIILWFWCSLSIHICRILSRFTILHIILSYNFCSVQINAIEVLLFFRKTECTWLVFAIISLYDCTECWWQQCFVVNRSAIKHFKRYFIMFLKNWILKAANILLHCRLFIVIMQSTLTFVLWNLSSILSKLENITHNIIYIYYVYINTFAYFILNGFVILYARRRAMVTEIPVTY